MTGKGCLIVFEGVNGAGKTTIIERIASHYRNAGVPHSVYKFPNRSGDLGKRIDDYLNGRITIESKYDILSMFAADREASRVQIEEDLKMGKFVLCDRYVFSAIAYQIPARLRKSTTKASIIRKYCSTIGYFDKDMPMPSITFLIKGSHLRKRVIVNKEIFHYKGNQSTSMMDTIHKVINQYTTKLVVIENTTGLLADSVLTALESISECA